MQVINQNMPGYLITQRNAQIMDVTNKIQAPRDIGQVQERQAKL